ncbi:unnamed protein product [Cochlearia groenlandica]
MGKISLLLFVVALIAIFKANECHRVGKFKDGALEKDLHKAEKMIEEDMKAKQKSIDGLKRLNSSEQMLKQLGSAYKKDMNLSTFEHGLKRFNRTVNIKKASPVVVPKKSVSIIQSILLDLGFTGGKK